MAKYRGTEPVPDVYKYCGVAVDRTAAFHDEGNIWALMDELGDARSACRVRNRPVDQKPALPDGSVWGGELDQDPVTLPLWAYSGARGLVKPMLRAMFKLPTAAVIDVEKQVVVIKWWGLLVLEDAVHSECAKKLRRGPRATWFGHYRNAQVDWHRYVLADRQRKDGRARADGRIDGAFSVVSAQLKGTAFGGSLKAIEASFDRVAADVKVRRYGRFYRAHSFALYEQLALQDDSITIIVA